MDNFIKKDETFTKNTVQRNELSTENFIKLLNQVS